MRWLERPIPLLCSHFGRHHRWTLDIIAGRSTGVARESHPISRRARPDFRRCGSVRIEPSADSVSWSTGRPCRGRCGSVHTPPPADGPEWSSRRPLRRHRRSVHNATATQQRELVLQQTTSPSLPVCAQRHRQPTGQNDRPADHMAAIVGNFLGPTVEGGSPSVVKIVTGHAAYPSGRTSTAGPSSRRCTIGMSASTAPPPRWQTSTNRWSRRTPNSDPSTSGRSGTLRPACGCSPGCRL